MFQPSGDQDEYLKDFSYYFMVNGLVLLPWDYLEEYVTQIKSKI